MSAAVRALIVSASLGAAMLGAVVASRLVPRPAGGILVVAWWLAIVALSTLLLLAVNRVGRRLLPLAALLNLSMVFPDKAPARFRIAFRAGTIGSLQRRLAEARAQGVSDQPSDAAATILTLVSAMTAHDRRTRGHSERVRAFNDLLAEELKLPDDDRERLRWAALLHDVGKLRTPPRILNKPGPLTAEEWKVVHRHPEDGARIAAPLRDWLGPWAAAIEQHHERWDGSGYPRGLAGQEISFGARIVAVADAYEVMTSPRPYHEAKSTRAAREELACAAAGSQFDPVVVRAFLNASLGSLRKVVGPVSWLAGLPFLVSGSQMAAAAAAVGRQVVVAASAASAVGMLSVSGLLEASPPQPLPSPAPPAPPQSASPSGDAGGASGRAVAPPGPGGARPGSAWPSRAASTAAQASQPNGVGGAPGPSKRVVRIDPAELGVGGGVPPIEVSVPDPLVPPLPPSPISVPVR